MGVDQIVERLALQPGELILEVGLDSDCDNEFRSAIEKRTGTKFIEDATTEVVDGFYSGGAMVMATSSMILWMASHT
jgi:hypothetical protein